jgi:hypothetical protein
MGLSVVLTRFYSFQIGPFRVHVAAELMQDGSQVICGRRMLWLCRKHLLVGRDGIFQPTGIPEKVSAIIGHPNTRGVHRYRFGENGVSAYEKVCTSQSHP